jgi:uncharacterized protein YjiS (DUF1127 family)
MSSKGRPSFNQQASNDPNRAANVNDARLEVIDNWASADNMLIWAQRSHLTKTSPDLVPSITPTAEPGNTSLWSSLLSSIRESIVERVALYGASTHPAGFLADSYFGTEEPIKTANEDSSETCYAPSVASAPAPSGRRWHSAFVVAPQRRSMWGGSSRNPVATLWAQWRRERDIRNAVAALEQCDDRVLRDMGIPQHQKRNQPPGGCPDRADIEIRCRDCGR